MNKFSPTQYLQIDIANNFGLDKEDWEDRLNWVTHNENNLEDLVSQADEPALYYAAVKAYRAAQHGQPVGYPISLDATSSGLQILAALTGDRKAAELCNVVPQHNSGKKRRDGYTVIYNHMLAVLGESSQITREDTKRAIMTSLYGSQAVPKEVFGEGIMLKVFFDTMQELAPAAWELNEAFLTMWNPEATVNSWVLPDNFHVHVKVMTQVEETVHFLNKPFTTLRKVNAPMEEGRSLGANTIHSLDAMIVREITRRCDYDKGDVYNAWMAMDGNAYNSTAHDTELAQILWDHYLETGYLSARIIPLISNETVKFMDHAVLGELLTSLPKKPFKVLAVHDCFRVHPNYGNDLREQYTRQLYLIARSNLLQSLLSQIVGRPLTIGKLDPTLADDILTSDYALS